MNLDNLLLGAPLRRGFSFYPFINFEGATIVRMGAEPQRTFEFAEPPIDVDWTLAFSRPENRKALAYWKSVCGERGMPTRSNLSPRGMRDFITHVNLVDVWPASGGGSVDYEIILQGSHGREVLGHLVRRKFNAGLSEMTARRLRECLNIVRDWRRPVRVRSRITAGGKSWLDSESFMGPLSAPDPINAVAGIMWVFVSWHATAGRTASRNPTRLKSACAAPSLDELRRFASCG